ncbi:MULTISPECIES: hypothetical protein [Niastella]|uniref:Uncharacterized protein n=1 Tax=Niastella soli TaxID=2821487 RepID=A0ABS3Z380_9BACT|nr:hypothetical protein [Niastella soli]MBO9204192.1 hypothetical protein [Niastella soli]
MKLILILKKFVFPITVKQNNCILDLQHTVNDLIESKNELIIKVGVYRKELQFIYSILIARPGCQFRLFPLLKQPLLLAIENTASQMNFYLYMPNQQSNEIAMAYTNKQENTHVIYELYVEPTYCNSHIYSFLLYQVNTEAKRMDLPVVYACSTIDSI